MRKSNRSTTVDTHRLEVENKTFHVDLKENDRGQFLQIAELSNDKRSTVIIPGSGITKFLEAVEKIKEEYL